MNKYQLRVAVLAAGISYGITAACCTYMGTNVRRIAVKRATIAERIQCWMGLRNLGHSIPAMEMEGMGEDPWYGGWFGLEPPPKFPAPIEGMGEAKANSICLECGKTLRLTNFKQLRTPDGANLGRICDECWMEKSAAEQAKTLE